MRPIVINTIAFSKALLAGASQADFFVLMKHLGVQQVELRQEYFRGDMEIGLAAEKAQSLGLSLRYSVLQPLFVNGCLSEERLFQNIVEAQRLSAISLKCAIGDFVDLTANDRTVLRDFSHTFAGELMVENGQTRRDGSLKKLFSFLRACAEAEIDLGMTFDVGNWYWVRENPMEAAELFYPYIRYIHVKDAQAINETSYQAMPLGHGEIPLAAILDKLPPKVPLALEYPAGTDPEVTLRQGIHWLQHYEIEKSTS